MQSLLAGWCVHAAQTHKQSQKQINLLDMGVAPASEASELPLLFEMTLKSLENMKIYT